MLASLQISNYALIEELFMKPNPSFTIITGETGAGKSILLGALGLIIGQRADLNALKNKEKKCIVEAKFEIKNYQLKSFFDENDLDYEHTTIIRREISPNGKSRAFINDTPVNLNLLKELGEQLIDIHSQHQTIALNDQSFQLRVIDAIADNKDILKAYQSNFKKYQTLKRDLADKEASINKAKSEEDFLQFQFDELDRLNLKINEDQELEEEQDNLEHVEDTKSASNSALQLLKEQEENILSMMASVKIALSDAAKHNKNIGELQDRFKSVFIELEDITDEIESENDDLVYDPERLEYIRERLSAIYNLQKKHQLTSVEELLQLKADLEDKLIQISNFDDNVMQLKKDIQLAEKELSIISNQLSDRRKDAKKILEKRVEGILSQLSMKNAVLEVQINREDKFRSYGNENIQFLFTANKGVELRDLSKVASGGELSRLMLAIKSILAEKESLPTIIFDEIDTGISGEIADQVGSILKSMSQSLQIISITHLAQMAAKGKMHLKVFKKDNNDATSSYIKELSEEERVEELAKMLSGAKTSAAAIENAKELLKD